jgi:hypothetical protein
MQLLGKFRKKTVDNTRAEECILCPVGMNRSMLIRPKLVSMYEDVTPSPEKPSFTSKHSLGFLRTTEPMTGELA